MAHAFSKTIIITGHYGSGKTNLAVNLALDLRKQGRSITLADLDVVNPYFRAADFAELAQANDIRLMIPPYAKSNLDLPSLTIALSDTIDSGCTLIIDVGGDDAGATALGRYAPRLNSAGYDMIYVVNRKRMQIADPEEALVLLREIEIASRLKATHVANNTHLGHETTPQIVFDSVQYAEECAKECGLPLLFSAMRRDLYDELEDKQGFYPIDIHVDLPWYKK
jgi:hypothetical protein